MAVKHSLSAMGMKMVRVFADAAVIEAKLRSLRVEFIQVHSENSRHEQAIRIWWWKEETLAFHGQSDVSA